MSGPGLGVFTFDGPGDLGGSPVRVWYSAPEGGASSAEILVVMHGTGRDAESYRADWEPLVRGRDVVVLVPEFDEQDYPGASSYNLGDLVDSAGDPRPQEEWAFSMIEALFDYVVADVGSETETYALFGHSAGAQFVHRFVEFVPDQRVSVAVAANAGWYTVTENSVDFPYGLGGESPAREDDMGPALASDLVILLGADDIDPDDESLRHDDESDDQGSNRLERGLNFFLTAREMAAERELPFTWRLIVVPGVAHSHTDMAKAAAPLILDDAG